MQLKLELRVRLGASSRKVKGCPRHHRSIIYNSTIFPFASYPIHLHINDLVFLKTNMKHLYLLGNPPVNIFNFSLAIKTGFLSPFLKV